MAPGDLRPGYDIYRLCRIGNRTSSLLSELSSNSKEKRSSSLFGAGRRAAAGLVATGNGTYRSAPTPASATSYSAFATGSARPRRRASS